MKTIVKLEQDENGDVILPLSEEICNQLGWSIGDKLSFKLLEEGKIEIIKSDSKEESKKKLVMVETISSFRMRYLIEVDENSSDEKVKDFVKNQIEEGFPELKEFTQSHVGEIVIGQRDVSENELKNLAQEDGDIYARNLKGRTTKIKE